MNRILLDWDYLIITASNDEQAGAYRTLIELRRSLGVINGVRNILVVADPGGRRVGSGGSTIHCLLEVINRESRESGGRLKTSDPLDTPAWKKIFENLRILIVHAGGDSKRLPPYGPCGKLFVPVPGESDSALGATLFDRLIPTYLELPPPASGTGQVVVASGDVLLAFDTSAVRYAADGITGLGCLAPPEVAKNHGVYCRYEDGLVRLFLQKPPVEKQKKKGAIDAHGQAILDIGILNIDPAAAVRLLELSKPIKAGKARLEWSGPVAGAIEKTGLDIYREICCAMGKETGFRDYEGEVRAAGSQVDGEVLGMLYRALRSIPFHVDVIPWLRFLHFGTLPELVESGKALLSAEMGGPEKKSPNILINSLWGADGTIQGKNSWIEGCLVNAPLTVAGENIITGIDIGKPLSVPRGACLDVLEGRSREGRKGWFVRVYGIDDVFHRSPDRGAQLCGLPVYEWIEAMGAAWTDAWDNETKPEDRAVWTGRFFPFVEDAAAYHDWLWLYDPLKATADEKREWRGAARYSFEDMARLAAQDAFHSRRLNIRAQEIHNSLPWIFGPESELSAAELAFLLLNSEKGKQARWAVEIIREAHRCFEADGLNHGVESLELSRILHTLGSALLKAGKGNGSLARGLARTLDTELANREKIWLASLGLALGSSGGLKSLAGRMQHGAFDHLSRTVVRKKGELPSPPKNVLRSDEIVWGRAPARLDLGGGWTDTPPYSLERGGCVINAAVNLNGQAPIQAYARIIEKPEIRLNSIDHSTRAVIRNLDELLDYRKPTSQFALAKAALALAGFAPDGARWPKNARTLNTMLRHFGGGIELTTLAAIPSGSGLGTSSIMGAVLMSVIGRITGREFTHRELFHTVLQLEQEMTTGGGWQDQIGGVIEGVKLISAKAGLVPDPRIQFVPAELLDPALNGGRTLLFYTGLRRLAKNILHEVVGRYLDRDRAAMATLRRLHAFPPMMAEAMSMRDLERFGALVDAAWKLNVDLDPDHSTPVIEELRELVRPHMLGAKLLGAGGGGFLLIVCKSSDDAATVKRILGENPPNDKARFFDYSISREGLVTTVC